MGQAKQRGTFDQRKAAARAKARAEAKALADRGRYQVAYYDPDEKATKVYGYTDDMEVIREMGEAIAAHPRWEFPHVHDTRPES